MKRTPRLAALAPALPIIAGLFWGSVAVFVRFLYQAGFDNKTILFLRMSIAAVLLLVWILITDRSQLRVCLKDFWLLAVGAVTGCYGLNWFYNEAIAELSVSLAAVLLSLFAIFAIFLGRIFFKEPITKRKIPCACIALFGVVLVSGALENASGQTLSTWGIVAGLMSAACYAVSGLCIRFASGRGYSTFTINFYYALIIGIVLLVFADWSAISGYVAAKPVSHGGFLLLHSLCTMLLPYVLFAASLKHVELGKAAILATDETAAAMLYGLIFFHEVPTALMVVGLVIVIVALAIMNLPSKTERKQASE